MKRQLLAAGSFAKIVLTAGCWQNDLAISYLLSAISERLKTRNKNQQMTQILQVYSKRNNQHEKQGGSNLTKEYGKLYANTAGFPLEAHGNDGELDNEIVL